MIRIPRKNIALFIVTFFCLLAAGAIEAGVDVLSDPGGLVKGLPYALSLMAILLTHEMGHYVMSLRHKVEATLPFFIPVPPISSVLNIGTLGAIIRMRSPINTRTALIDIGASGPIVGFVVALVFAVVGLALSEPVAIEASTSDVLLGPSILFSFLMKLVAGPLPEGMGLELHPLAFSGWLGFFITSLNLIPVGQLDGGHILYAMIGEKHHLIGKVLVAVLVIMGLIFWPGWIIWAVLMLIIGLRHPPVIYREPRLDRQRRMAGAISLVIFVLTFTPAPFMFIAG